MMFKIISFLLLLPNLVFGQNDGNMWNFQCTDGCVGVCDGLKKPYSDSYCVGVQCLCICKDGSQWGSGVTCGTGRLAGSVYTCFSSHTTVEVKEKGSLRMKDIKVGDEVLTADGNYKTIYTIDHRHPTKSVDFLQIYSSKYEEPLELTEKHMVFLEGNSNPVPAGAIHVGDELHTLQGPSIVTKVDTVNREGLFSPITTDGTIVASGIASSSYSAVLGKDEWIEIAGEKVVSQQKFFNMLLKPYKYICTSISLELCETTNEKTAISQFAAEFHNYASQQSELFQSTVLSFIILMVFLADFIMSSYGAAGVAILALTSGVKYWKNKM